MFQRGNSLGCVDRDACGDSHRRDRQKHLQWRHRHSVVAAKGRGVAVNAAGLCPASLARPAFFFLKLPAGDPAAMASRVQKIMLQPINLIFRFLQTRQRVEVWLYAATDTRMRGFIVGFDEYMNVVLDEAVEVSLKRKTATPLGRILLKGDTISLLCSAPADDAFEGASSG